MSRLLAPFYNPELTYKQNFTEGPFGAFANKEIYENKGEPTYEIFGTKVHVPFGIPAGPLLNGTFVKAALDKGFDVVVYKTVRTQKYPSNEWPNVLGIKIDGDLTLEKAEQGVLGTHEYTKPLSVTNSFGVPSLDPEFWQKDLIDAIAHAKEGQLVIGSFQGTTNKDGDIAAYVQDFADAAKMVKQTGAKVLEVNLSCPNEGSAHLLCFDIPRTKQVVEAIKNEIGNTPLIIKIAYFADKDLLRKLVEEVGGMVDGISAINTIPAKILDKEGNQALPGGPNRLKAGICGTPIQWAGLETVKNLKSLREELGMSYKIFGVGGVTSAEDYQKYRDAGADVVMSATGAMWNPYLAQEIKQNV